MILDSIYNEGKLQEIYKSMSKKVKDYFADYDEIFTLNYDNNIQRHIPVKKTFFIYMGTLVFLLIVKIQIL